MVSGKKITDFDTVSGGRIMDAADYGEIANPVSEEFAEDSFVYYPQLVAAPPSNMPLGDPLEAVNFIIEHAGQGLTEGVLWGGAFVGVGVALNLIPNVGTFISTLYFDVLGGLAGVWLAERTYMSVSGQLNDREMLGSLGQITSAAAIGIAVKTFATPEAVCKKPYAESAGDTVPPETFVEGLLRRSIRPDEASPEDVADAKMTRILANIFRPVGNSQTRARLDSTDSLNAGGVAVVEYVKPVVVTQAIARPVAIRQTVFNTTAVNIIPAPEMCPVQNARFWMTPGQDEPDWDKLKDGHNRAARRSYYKFLRETLQIPINTARGMIGTLADAGQSRINLDETQMVRQVYVEDFFDNQVVMNGNTPERVTRIKRKRPVGELHELIIAFAMKRANGSLREMAVILQLDTEDEKRALLKRITSTKSGPLFDAWKLYNLRDDDRVYRTTGSVDSPYLHAKREPKQRAKYGTQETSYDAAKALTQIETALAKHPNDPRAAAASVPISWPRFLSFVYAECLKDPDGKWARLAREHSIPWASDDEIAVAWVAAGGRLNDVSRITGANTSYIKARRDAALLGNAGPKLVEAVGHVVEGNLPDHVPMLKGPMNDDYLLEALEAAGGDIAKIVEPSGMSFPEIVNYIVALLRKNPDSSLSRQVTALVDAQVAPSLPHTPDSAEDSGETGGEDAGGSGKTANAAHEKILSALRGARNLEEVFRRTKYDRKYFYRIVYNALRTEPSGEMARLALKAGVRWPSFDQIADALLDVDGNYSDAADALGIGESILKTRINDARVTDGGERLVNVQRAIDLYNLFRSRLSNAELYILSRHLLTDKPVSPDIIAGKYKLTVSEIEWLLGGLYESFGVLLSDSGIGEEFFPHFVRSFAARVYTVQTALPSDVDLAKALLKNKGDIARTAKAFSITETFLTLRFAVARRNKPEGILAQTLNLLKK